MNKCIINSLVVALVLLVPCLASALPGVHDPNSGRGYTCNHCHTSGATIGNKDSNTEVTKYSTNVCFRCHVTGGAYVATKRFEQTDFANPFKTSVNIAQPAGKVQTSHKWFGSDVVPAAGAVAPVDTAVNGLNKNVYFKGTLFCARCHNVHGTSGTQSLSIPYLRYPNDRDQMCLNCHAPRNVISHTLGSHPVNISYTSASVRAKIAAFTLLSTPVKTQTAIPGKYSQVKLVNGMVVCSTCHGIHGTDSRSSTFDIVTSISFRPLSSSKGYLLRVDARGKTANALNICTNCHAGKTAHNKVGQNIQCNDCHSGHVEYDPAVVPDGQNVPNSFLVRRYIQYSSNLRVSKRVFYRYTGESRKEYYNTTPGMYGVCQGCHYPNSTTANHFLQSGDPTSGLNGSHLPNQCSSCHIHTAANGSFSYEAAAGSCITTCHGFPPHLATSGTDGEAGNGTNYTRFNESLTPHMAHAGNAIVNTNYGFKCDQCHRGASMSNGVQFENTNYVEVFKTHTGAAGINGGYIYAGKIASYTTTTFACNNVYCHSNGKGKYKAGQQGILWSSAIGSIMAQGTRCATCHRSATTFDNTSTGHYTHTYVNAGVTMGYGCQTCHANTVTDSTTLNPVAMGPDGVHVNGVKDFVFNQGANPPAIGTSCATIACHSNGKGAAPVDPPQWRVATSGDCGSCHYATSPPIATDSHFTHLSSVTGNAWGPRLTGAANVQCVFCHTYNGERSAPHVDGTIDVNTAGTCTTQCHRNGTPNWLSASRLACESCHDGNVSYDSRAGFNNISAPRKVMTTFTAQGHGQYNAYVCTSCHVDTGKHINKLRGDSTRLGAYEGAVQNNLCSSCHNNAGIVTNANRRITVSHAANYGHGTGTLLCSACHDVHGTANYASVIASIRYKAISSAVIINKPATSTDFINTITKRGLCQVCHTLTNHFRRGVTEPAAGFNNNPSNQDHSGFGSTYNCLSCHPHINGTIAFYPAGGACDSCHGYPPVRTMGTMGHQNNYSSAKLQNYSGGGGVHSVPGHLLPTIKATAGINGCTNCHYSVPHTMTTSVWAPANSTTTRKAPVNVVVDPMYKFNATRTLDESRYVKTTPANSGACWNVSCHFRPTPSWATDK